MKKLIIVVTLLGIAAAQVKAQDTGARTGQAGAADAVHARVLNVEAMSWAWRIEKAENITYQTLEKQSANWGRGEAVRGQLLAKIKEIINSGRVRLLTAGEDAELEAAKAEVKTIASGGVPPAEKSARRSAARQAAIDRAAREMLEPEAKYWAWRIAVVRDVTYDELQGHSEGWMRGVEVSGELLAKVKANLQSGDTPALNRTEQANLDACKKRIKQLVSRA